MDRRAFLTSVKGRSAEPLQVKKSSAFRTSSGLSPYTGTWSQAEVVHLLKRTMFGARPVDISYFLTKTMSQAVDELLNPIASFPSPPVKDYATTDAATPDLDVAPGATWIQSINYDGVIQSGRIASLKRWWNGVLLNQDRSIREKMTLFWHNHFATQMTEVVFGNLSYKHVHLLRTDALGNFKQMVKDVTLDPAMLIYLNGVQNRKAAPDENYARELMELFTLGKENNPNYTEADVQAAARVLTGWQIDTTNNTFPSVFNLTRHDTANKQFSSFFNNTVIVGRTGSTAGELELNDLLNMIFSKQLEVSRFMARKLYRFFVYSEIDAAAETNVIEPLALQLRSSNWEIKPALALLFKSEHFYDVINRGAQIKTPLDHVIGYCREWNLVFPDVTTNYADAYGMWNLILAMGILGQQNIGDPPSVAGWPAYYQIPQYYELWINTDTLPKRNQFTDGITAVGYAYNNKLLIMDPVGYTKTLKNPADPNTLMNEVLDRIYSIALSQQSKDQLKKDFLLSGQEQDYYWTSAWNTYMSDPSNTSNYNIVYVRLVGLYKYFMNLAEYQLM